MNALELITVEYVGPERIPADDRYLGERLPDHTEPGDTFQIERWRALSLAAHHPSYRVSEDELL